MTAQTGEPQRSAKIRRMTQAAFDTAVGVATSEATAGAEDPAVWAELERAGLAAGRALLPAWSDALAASPAAPVQIKIVAREGEVSFESEISLLPGLGLCRTQRVALRTTPTAYEPVSREEAVELVAFPPEDLWLAVRRVLPPRDALRAPLHITPPSRQRDLKVTPEAVEQLAQRLEGDPLGRTPAEILETAPELDPELRAVLAGGSAEVALLVGAVTGPDDVTPVGACRWTVVGEQLYSLRSTPDAVAVVAVEDGDLAADLIWYVTGAYNLVSEIATEAAGR
ncbi:hypothetical protein [Janibacter limosus]|uniref:hypothetical protein n=1 Tax=Janibacter limosus TaxID=53458 RepID=UPI0008313E44|nr:hypothetical protein [Janibacter limosus]